MRCVEHGPEVDDEKPIAVVAAIHGDEPCGVRAVQRLLAQSPTFHRHVKFIIANERAFERGVRCIDEDLNRVCPGFPTADSYERRLAPRLLSEIEDSEVLTLHSTDAEPTPFALVQQWTPTTKRLMRATGVEEAVDISYVDGGLEAFVDGVAVECGPTGSDAAAETAFQILERVLINRGALSGRAETSDPNVFRIFDSVDRDDLWFCGSNFEQVEPSDVFARKVGHPCTEAPWNKIGEAVAAEREFYPVLMSNRGYDDMLGFRAELVGAASAV